MHDHAYADSDSERDEDNYAIEQQFLFGVSLHLGSTTNNYAEYMGLIIALLIQKVSLQEKACVFSDS